MFHLPPAPGGERKREVLYTMPLKKNALGPSEAACIEQYKVVSKEDGGWLVTLYVTTPKVRLHTLPLVWQAVISVSLFTLLQLQIFH